MQVDQRGFDFFGFCFAFFRPWDPICWFCLLFLCFLFGRRFWFSFCLFLYLCFNLGFGLLLAWHVLSMWSGSVTISPAVPSLAARRQRCSLPRDLASMAYGRMETIEILTSVHPICLHVRLCYYFVHGHTEKKKFLLA